MSILGADAVEAAASSGRLVVGPGDRLTPLGHDRARELGVEIVTADSANSAPDAAPAARAAAPGTPSDGRIPRVRLDQPGSLPSPPVPALFRRGAPIPRSDTGTVPGGRRTRVSRVTVVGAGNVGTHAAMRLAETDLIDEIVLVDVAEGLARGVALDLTHASGLLRFGTRIRGEGSIEAAGESEYTILTAGKPRTPGMSRTDLTVTNAAIVGALAASVGRVSPAGVIVVVTNPLDEMTELAWKSSGLPAGHVIGMAGLLDSARFHALSSLETGSRADTVTGFALGSHGEEMVIPVSQTRVGELGADRALGGALTAVIERTRDSGAEVVALLGRGSAFITPGLAAARMVEHMIRDDGRVISATVRPEGQYGLRDVYIGLPVRLGPTGLAQVVELPLAPAESDALHTAATRIRERVAALARS